MGSISIWDEEAALQSCWFDCESQPTAAYSYPSNDQDFRYLTGYRDDLSRADWYDNVLFFSCLSGCRAQLRAERWLYIMVPAISALVLFLLLVICCVCKGCPLARWYRDSRANTAKINPNQTPPPNPFLVSSIADFDAGYGYNSLGFAQSNPYKRRVSTLDRKYASGTSRAHWDKLMTISSSVSRMQHLDTTMASLANLTAAPPAALYNPLDHGRNLAKEGSSSRQKTKSSSRKSSRVKVARAN